MPDPNADQRLTRYSRSIRGQLVYAAARVRSDLGFLQASFAPRHTRIFYPLKCSYCSLVNCMAKRITVFSPYCFLMSDTLKIGPSTIKYPELFVLSSSIVTNQYVFSMILFCKVINQCHADCHHKHRQKANERDDVRKLTALHV